jgi:ABC-type branched-subunit amino acid transport system permease subunit
MSRKKILLPLIKPHTHRQALALGSDVLTQLGISVLLLAVLAQSWNIIGGFTGYPSFGNSVFYGLGSYGVAIAMVQWKLSFGIGLLFGVALEGIRVGISACSSSTLIR